MVSSKSLETQLNFDDIRRQIAVLKDKEEARHKILQLFSAKQWEEALRVAKEKGVDVIGDPELAPELVKSWNDLTGKLRALPDEAKKAIEDALEAKQKASTELAQAQANAEAAQQAVTQTVLAGQQAAAELRKIQDFQQKAAFALNQTAKLAAMQDDLLQAQKQLYELNLPGIQQTLDRINQVPLTSELSQTDLQDFQHRLTGFNHDLNWLESVASHPDEWERLVQIHQDLEENQAALSSENKKFLQILTNGHGDGSILLQRWNHLADTDNQKGSIQDDSGHYLGDFKSLDSLIQHGSTEEAMKELDKLEVRLHADGSLDPFKKVIFQEIAGLRRARLAQIEQLASSFKAASAFENAPPKQDPHTRDAQIDQLLRLIDQVYNLAYKAPLEVLAASFEGSKTIAGKAVSIVEKLNAKIEPLIKTAAASQSSPSISPEKWEAGYKTVLSRLKERAGKVNARLQSTANAGSDRSASAGSYLTAPPPSAPPSQEAGGSANQETWPRHAVSSTVQQPLPSDRQVESPVQLSQQTPGQNSQPQEEPPFILIIPPQNPVPGFTYEIYKVQLKKGTSEIKIECDLNFLLDGPGKIKDEHHEWANKLTINTTDTYDWIKFHFQRDDPLNLSESRLEVWFEWHGKRISKIVSMPGAKDLSSSHMDDRQTPNAPRSDSSTENAPTNMEDPPPAQNIASKSGRSSSTSVHPNYQDDQELVRKSFEGGDRGFQTNSDAFWHSASTQANEGWDGSSRVGADLLQDSSTSQAEEQTGGQDPSPESPAQPTAPAAQPASGEPISKMNTTITASGEQAHEPQPPADGETVSLATSKTDTSPAEDTAGSSFAVPGAQEEHRVDLPVSQTSDQKAEGTGSGKSSQGDAGDKTLEIDLEDPSKQVPQITLTGLKKGWALIIKGLGTGEVIRPDWKWKDDNKLFTKKVEVDVKNGQLRIVQTATTPAEIENTLILTFQKPNEEPITYSVHVLVQKKP